MPGFSPKPVIIAVGIYVPGYGLTRVFLELFARLSKYYTIHWLGLAWRGAVTENEHYTLHPSNLKGGDMYGAAEAAAMAVELNASAIWLLNDLYMLRNYGHTWEPLKEKKIKLVGYIPLDGDIADEDIMADTLFLDTLILYNEWALEQVTNATKKYLLKNNVPPEQIPQTDFVYHGVDTDFFSPVTADVKKRLKEKLFAVPEPGEAVFILNANRYNERKDIEATIAGFSKAFPLFTRPAYLCLHTPGIHQLKLDELQQKINALPAASRILLNPLGKEYISNELLRDLYRACDIGVNTSVGEGWGLISFEHAACGAGQLVPGHSAPAVLWKDAGIQLLVKAERWLDTSPFRMYSIDEDELATQLIRLVNEEESKMLLRVNSYSYSVQKKFNWNTAAEKWKQLLPRN
jgi:glycosyltransferase involved in cell wall biosynthesis